MSKSDAYNSYNTRGGSSGGTRAKDYSPYQQNQRPSSAGVTRSRNRSAHSSSGNSGSGGNGVNYARNAQGGGQHGGQQTQYMQTPVISAALLGSGYNMQGQRGHQRPSSAGTTRQGSGHHSSSRNAQQNNDGHAMPSLNPNEGGNGTGNGNSSSRGGSFNMRPKSAGVVRRPSGNDNANAEQLTQQQQQQMYYQQQMHQQQKQAKAKQMSARPPSGSSGGASGSGAAQGQGAPSGSNNNSSNNNVSDHWSTSYKLHYGYGGNEALPNTANANGSALHAAAKGGADAAVGHTNLNGTKAPSSQRPSSATARIRTAVDNGQKYALPADQQKKSSSSSSNSKSGKANNGSSVTANNTNAAGVLGTEEGDTGGVEVEGQEGRQLLVRDDDDDEMDGKPVGAVGAHPEVSTATPSQSIELQSSSVGIDNRNGSLDSIGEIVDVGISTLPNQFCSCRDALDLRKLLLLSKGSRGGVVPSSTAVMDMYMVGKVVGVGSYGKVRAAWHRLTGSKVAIKTYDKSKLKDPAHWKRVHSEIKIMEQVSHPRIARMYEAVETPKRMHLIMECLDGGNLCSYVKAKRRLSEDESRKIFFQILQAVEHLHMLGVTHRDIKLENVLFADNKDIKLIDFGFSTVCQPGKRLKVFCGTPSYMAPEIVRRTEYEGKPVDMWSLGILLYALLCGCFPFRAKSYPDLYRRIARGTFAIPEELSASVKDLLRQFLTVDVSTRITAHAAMRHSWLQVQLATSPDIAKMRLETPILISDKPSDDVDEKTLAELDKFGLGKDEVIRLILTKTHSSIATFYYLLLDVNLSKRRLMMNKRTGSASNSKQRASSSLSTSGSGQGQGQYYQGTGTAPSGSRAEQFLVQQGQNAHAHAHSGTGLNLLRPKSASTGRQASSGPQRPLSAFATRR